ncbi:uncharacterized protein CLUP02_01500 [Colletotrichum lupini]|uniref:Uncharacterized protein n=2 Tax=Colletotrichum acutatum species complex TaxID=2707335 RepID=A0A9Q8SD16_9PEZI|nr:uncharacterized protein CLUP02_01500 [Colletotrichum lupini]KAK1458353.1 hypothetical protein CCUS01_09452 [Colletotrichum cuscutae]UQC74848.1 hypothetical protein CLUP02_01500 [Colletotrichum lupini]
MRNVFPATKLFITVANPCHSHGFITASVSIILKAMYYHGAQANSSQERRSQKAISDRKRICALQ